MSTRFKRDTSVRFGAYDTYADFKMLLIDEDLGFPELQTNKVTVPGRDGDVDLTAMIDSTPHFGNRVAKWKFALVHSENAFWYKESAPSPWRTPCACGPAHNAQATAATQIISLYFPKRLFMCPPNSSAACLRAHSSPRASPGNPSGSGNFHPYLSSSAFFPLRHITLMRFTL